MSKVLDPGPEIEVVLKVRMSDEKDEILHQSGDTIAEKLISMSKKNRALNLETEKERTKARNLEREIRELHHDR